MRVRRAKVRREADRTATLPLNPLLPSWAQDAREMQLVLAGREAVVRDHRTVDDSPPTLLGRIRSGGPRASTIRSATNVLIELMPRQQHDGRISALAKAPCYAPKGDTMGRPVTYFEVMGKDGEKLRDFYAELFGWTIDAKNPLAYGIVQRETNFEGVGIGGGIGAIPPRHVGTRDLLGRGARYRGRARAGGEARRHADHGPL